VLGLGAGPFDQRGKSNICIGGHSWPDC
jgi:hypothetical protein